MSETLRFKHWANSGDLISCLPGIRQFWKETGRKAIIQQRIGIPAHYYEGAEHPVINKDGVQVAMTEEMLNMLKPLLEHQEYVEKVELWEGQEFDINLDQMRENKYTPAPNGDIYWWQPLTIPQMATDFSEQWIFVEDSDLAKGKIILNFTERYRNPLISYYFLKEYEDRLMFVGTIQEHGKFCEQNKLHIPYLFVDNFYTLAQAIQSCDFFMGNQSMCFHIAEGLKKERMLEVSIMWANVYPHGKNGYPYLHQPNLEYYFKKLLK